MSISYRMICVATSGAEDVLEVGLEYLVYTDDRTGKTRVYLGAQGDREVRSSNFVTRDKYKGGK